jgi:hypothetical protein
LSGNIKECLSILIVWYSTQCEYLGNKSFQPTTIISTILGVVKMGSGRWTSSSYAKSTGAKIASGTTMGYDAKMRTTSRTNRKAHEDLDPKRVAGPSSPFAGQTVRESRDNVDHPNSVPIATIYDSTGSMGQIPRVVQQKLGGLFGLLLRKGYVEDPQVMIGTYGDAYTDQVPLQISQFESDNRIDENLDNIFAEGNGGGNGGETQSLAWYYLTYHTVTDAWEKRGKKGYAFFVADEIALDLLPAHVNDNIGDGEPLGALDTKALAKAVSEKWDVYILLIDNMSAKIQGSEKFYKELFGEQHVLVVEDPNSITETIALTIGVMEGNVDFDDAVDDLKSTGASDIAVRSATSAVSHLRGATGGQVVKGLKNLVGAARGAARL